MVPIRRRYARLGRTRNKEMDVLAAIPEDRPDGGDSQNGGSDDSSVVISSGVASRLNGPRRTKGEGKKGQVGENQTFGRSYIVLVRGRRTSLLLGSVSFRLLLMQVE